jgi:hypothetical protein
MIVEGAPLSTLSSQEHTHKKCIGSFAGVTAVAYASKEFPCCFTLNVRIRLEATKTTTSAVKVAKSAKPEPIVFRKESSRKERFYGKKPRDAREITW